MRRLEWKRWLEWASCACVIHLIVISAALAQQTSEALTHGSDIVTAPSIVRVVFVFLLMAGIAVGAAYAVRRYSPKFTNALVQRGPLRVIERTALHGGLRMHLVEVDGERILIAEARTGVSMLRLAASGEAKKDD